MQNRKTAFPLIVGVCWQNVAAAPEAVAALVKMLERLRNSSPSGVLAIHAASGAVAAEIEAAAGVAGVECRALTEANRAADGAGELEIVEGSDLVLDLCSATDSAESTTPLQAYAHEIKRPLIRIDAETGALRDKVPEMIDIHTGWLADLFTAAKLPATADLGAVHDAMNALAVQTATTTRWLWKAMLAIEWLAVLVPLAWMFRQNNLESRWVAAGVFLSALLLAALTWWLRWRGMQKAWTRARLVAEVTKAALLTRQCPLAAPWPAIRIVPDLRYLRWCPFPPEPAVPFPTWRDDYLIHRVKDQDDWFASKQKKAESTRTELTRWAIILPDAALVVGLLGLAIYLSPLAPMLSDWLGSDKLRLSLCIAGVVLTMSLLVVQLLRTFQDINRQTARYAQQRAMLATARARLRRADSEEFAAGVVAETERHLLAEVLEWYFQAETTEHFAGLAKDSHNASGIELQEKPHSPFWPVAVAVTMYVGIKGFFILRVLFGRAILVIGGAVAVLFLLLRLPGFDGKTTLRPLASVYGPHGDPWQPVPERIENGCVVIVHGLHDGVGKSEDPPHWMLRTASAIEKRLGDKAPNIILVDWHDPARPLTFHGLDLKLPAGAWIGDVLAVKGTAVNVGELLAYRLASAILDKSIRQDRPIEFIGHSAGGFAITKAALRLHSLGLAPAATHITILDTPQPDDSTLQELPNIFRNAVDFYITSDLVLPTTDFSNRYLYHEKIVPPEELSVVDQHSYAHEWFIKTIEPHDNKEKRSFVRSPLLRGLSKGDAAGKMKQ